MTTNNNRGYFGRLAAVSVAALIGLATLISLPGISTADADEQITAIGARLGGDAQRTRFVTDLTKPVSFSVTLLDNPYRVIVDLPNVSFNLPSALGKTGRGLVSAYRYGQFGEGKARIVMDVSGPVKVAKSFVVRPVGTQPARLVIDLEKSDAASFSAAIAKQRAIAAGGSAAPTGVDVSAEGIDKFIKEMERSVFTAAAPPPPAPKLEPEPEVEKPQVNPSANLILPKQKPKIGKNATSLAPPRAKRSHYVVVIDPGHGGVDPGATSRRGTAEKRVTLAFSKVLSKQLRKTGRYKVYMTRSRDRFIRLRDRVRLARRKNADLFIAIHADSLRRGKAQGATVYTLSERASDREAADLAAQENRADVIAGVDLETESEQVTGILIDLAQRETNNHSLFFAQNLARSIGKATKLTRKPLRSAGFRVLKAPDVPSVLLELGYLSSARDEKKLLSKKWQQKVAAAISNAIDTYFSKQLAQGN